MPLNGKNAIGPATPMLMPSMPAWICSRKCRAAAPESVKMEQALPNCEPLVNAMASSSVFVRTIDSTGPKISSRATRMSPVARSSNVGPR